MTTAKPAATPPGPEVGAHTTTQLGANSVAGNSVGGRQADEPLPEGIDPTINNDGTPQPPPQPAVRGKLQPDTNAAGDVGNEPTVTRKGKK